MRVYLIGFMGCGKSFVGKELVSVMNYKFLDTDDMISAREHQPIEEIFTIYGEEYFRSKERKVLNRTFEESDIVVATGGGLPCFTDNMKRMNKNGVTVYLEATPEFLFQRLVNEKQKRPLISKLSDDELRKFIQNKLAERIIFYEQAILKVTAAEINSEDMKEKILHAQQKS